MIRGAAPEAAVRALDLVQHIIADISAAAADPTGLTTGDHVKVLHSLVAGLEQLQPVPEYGPDQARHHPAQRWFDAAVDLVPPHRRPMADAFAAAAPFLQWNTAYAEVEASSAFERFRSNYTFATVAVPETWSPGTGPLTMPTTTGPALFLVIQGPGQIYPGHHHPAVEIYGIVAGTGQWSRGDEDPRPRRPGDVFVHESNMVHATTTNAEPTVSWAAWLGDLATGPTLT